MKKEAISFSKLCQTQVIMSDKSDKDVAVNYSNISCKFERQEQDNLLVGLRGALKANERF